MGNKIYLHSSKLKFGCIVKKDKPWLISIHSIRIYRKCPPWPWYKNKSIITCCTKSRSRPAPPWPLTAREHDWPMSFASTIESTFSLLLHQTPAPSVYLSLFSLFQVDTVVASAFYCSLVCGACYFTVRLRPNLQDAVLPKHAHQGTPPSGILMRHQTMGLNWGC